MAEEAKEFRNLADRGSNGDVAEDAGGEAAAEVLGGGVDADGKGIYRGLPECFGRGAGVLRSTRNDSAFRCRGKEREREVIDGGGFAGDAEVVHGVDAVGGDVHLEEVTVGVAVCVLAEGMNTFDGDAAEGEVFGEGAIVDREGGEKGAEPVGEDLHDGRLPV